MSDPPEVRPTSAADFLGARIETGQVVVYPVRQGSSMWLKKITVEAIQDGPRGAVVIGRNDTGRTVRLHELKRCVVVGGK
jgi:hypothetical protein